MPDSTGDKRSAATPIERLYPPGGSSAQSALDERRQRSFLAIPSLERARMLLPADSRLGSIALRRARRDITARDRLRTMAASAAIRWRAGRILGEIYSVGPVDSSIEAELSALFGCPIVPAIFLGPPRANRKPVIQIMTQAGVLLGIAKLGVSDLSDELVAAESRNLAMLGEASFASMIHPDLLGVINWNGHPLVVQSPLPIREQGVREDATVRNAAMREIAQSVGLTRGPWRESLHYEGLIGRIDRVDDSGLRSLMHEALDNGVRPDTAIEFGAWHGDLSAWNMAVTRDGRAMVWDWERYSTGVPIGFDPLHYEFMPLLKGSASGTGSAGIDLHRQAARILAPFEVPQSVAGSIATLYLIEIASRYAYDGQARTGVTGGDVAVWLGPMVQRLKEEG